MKKIIFLLPAFILLMLGFTFKAQCQYTCSTAIQIAADIENEYSFTSNYTEYWFKFIAADTINSVHIYESASNPQAEIDAIYLYLGNCNSLYLISSASELDSFALTEILIPTDTFYIKITRTSSGTEYFGFSFYDTEMDNVSPLPSRS